MIYRTRKSFERAYPVIEREIFKLQSQWTLHALPYLDFEDFVQICLTHIWDKWHLYDSERDLAHWVSAVARNQFANFLRDRMRCVKPCSRCVLAVHENECLYTSNGKQCIECPFYAKWIETRQHHAYSVNMPLPIANHESEVYSMPNEDYIDYDKSKRGFEKLLFTVLTEQERQIYKLLYIKNLSEVQVAKAMDWKVEKNRKNGGGSKRVKDIENIIVEKGKKVMKEKGGEIDF